MRSRDITAVESTIVKSYVVWPPPPIFEEKTIERSVAFEVFEFVTLSFDIKKLFLSCILISSADGYTYMEAKHFYNLKQNSSQDTKMFGSIRMKNVGFFPFDPHK